MAGLMHDFLLVARKEFDYWDSSNFYNHPQAIHLHDDLMHYIGDSLKWIPCHVPARRNKLHEHKGLNFYGPTIIKEEGASAAHNIFSLWAELFSLAPKVLKLTGAWGWIEGEPAESGKYSTIIVERDKVVITFRQIAEYGKRVIASEGSLYILHMGI